MRMLIGIFFKLKEGSRTRGHKAALVKEQCRLYMRKYSFSQRVINEWKKLPNDCVNASSVNMFKNIIDIKIFNKGGLHIVEQIVGLSISQWLPCPLAILNLLFGMAILLNLVKSRDHLKTYIAERYEMKQSLHISKGNLNRS